MVIPPKQSSKRAAGSLKPKLLVAMALLTIAVIPIGYSFTS